MPSSRGGETNPAKGIIQPDGSYFLKTANNSGLYPAKFKVSVSVFDQPQLKPGARSTVEPKSKIPEKYGTVANLGLELEIKSGCDTIDIRLVSK